MNIKNYEIWNNFVDLSIKENFPYNECTNKSHEQGVYEGKNPYLVVIQYSDSCSLIEAIPYIWKAADMENPEDYSCEKDEILCGWLNAENHNDFYDNVTDGIHNDSLHDGLVIGYIKI